MSDEQLNVFAFHQNAISPNSQRQILRTSELLMSEQSLSPVKVRSETVPLSATNSSPIRVQLENFERISSVTILKFCRQQRLDSNEKSELLVKSLKPERPNKSCLF